MPDPEAFGDIFNAYSVTDETTPGRPGGYWVRSLATVNKIELECYFEDITEKQRWEIHKWLNPESHGELIFDESPYVRYHVRPVQKPETETYERLACAGGGEVFSGKILINFAAYEPFGEVTVITSDEVTECEERTLAQTGLIEEAQMPYMLGDEMAAGTHLVYNPGTEATPAIIYFKGVAGNGITVTNATTGDVLKIINVPSGVTAENQIAYDARNASVRLHYGGQDNEFVYQYHDEGYITLAPGTLTRDVTVTGTAGSRDITSPGMFTKTMSGQYIYINGEWYFIGAVTDENHATLNVALASSVNTTTVVATLNLITVAPSANSTITSLQMNFIPLV